MTNGDMEMNRSFECPNCGGSLPGRGREGLVTCPYCGSAVMTHDSNEGDSVHLPAEARAEIEELLRRGKRIDAIKLYREHVSGTLKESKLAVESIAGEMGLKAGGASCTAVLAGILTALCMAWVLLVC